MPKQPIIRHNKSGVTLPKLKRMLNIFIEERVMRSVSLIIQDLEKLDPTDPKNILEFRKRMRDECKAALEEKDDRLHELMKSDKITDLGHEPMLAFYSCVVDYLISSKFRQAVQDKWGL